jgi:hypothetical protein
VQWQFSIEPKDESSEAMRDYRVSWRGCSFLSVLEQLADRGTGRFSGNNVGERVNEKTEVEGHHSEFGATSLVKPTPLSTALLQLVLLTSSSCRRSLSSCQIPKKDSSLLCLRPQTLWIRPLFLQLHTTTPLLPSQADRATASPGVPPFSHFLGNISVLRVPTTTAPTSPLLHFFFHLHPSIPSVGHPLTSLPIPPIISTPAIKQDTGPPVLLIGMRSFLVLAGVIALAGASPVSPSAKKSTTATTRTGTTTTTVYVVDPTADIDPACVVDPLDCLTSPQALGTPTRVVHTVKAPSAVTPSSAGITDIVDSATRKVSYVTSDIGDNLPITLGLPRHALEKSSALTASVAGPADIRVSSTGKAVSATSDVGEDLPLTIILPRHAIEDGSAVINRNPTSASLTNRNGTLSASGTHTTHPTVYIVPTTTSGVDQPPLDVVLCELDCYWDCVDTVGPEDEDSQLMCVYQCIDYCEGQHSSVTATAKMPSPTVRHRALPAPSALKRNITIPAWTKGVIRTTGSSRRHAPSSTPEVPSVVDDMHHCLEACVHGCNTVPGPQNACKVQCSRKCTAAIPNFPPVFADKALRPHQVDRRSLPTVTSAAHTADKNTSAEVSPDDYSRTLSKFQDVVNITSEFWDKYEDEQPDFNDDLFDVDVDDLKSIWDKLTASPAAHTIDRNATRALPIAPVATIKSMQSRLREDANKLFDLQWDFYNVMDDLRYARENISSDLSSLASAWHELAGPTLARRGVSMPEVTGTQTGDWYVIRPYFTIHMIVNIPSQLSGTSAVTRTTAANAHTTKARFIAALWETSFQSAHPMWHQYLRSATAKSRLPLQPASCQSPKSVTARSKLPMPSALLSRRFIRRSRAQR